MDFLDSKISDNMSKIISNMEAGEALKNKDEEAQKNEAGSKKDEQQGGSEEESSSQKKSSSSEEKSSNQEQGGSSEQNNESGDEKSNNKSGGETSKSSEKQTNMSVQYSENGRESSVNWDDIMKNTQEISDSWSVIESDLLTKNTLKQSDFDSVKNTIDNLIVDASSKQIESTIKDSAEFYNGLCTILNKIDYDKNRYDILRIKQYIYEAYYDVLTNNWENVKINIETANTKIKNINNVSDETKISFSNLLSSVDKKNDKAFFIKCSDALSRLEQITTSQP